MVKISASELAKLYSITVQTVYNWVKQGCPHGYNRKGKKLVLEFDKNDVQNWVREQRGE